MLIWSFIMKHVIILNTHKTLKSNIYEIFLYNRIFLTQIKKTHQIILIKIQTISAKKYIRKPKGRSIRALIEKDPIPHTHIKKSKDTHTRQILASVTAIRLHRWRAWQYFTFFYSGPFLFLHFFSILFRAVCVVFWFVGGVRALNLCQASANKINTGTWHKKEACFRLGRFGCWKPEGSFWGLRNSGNMRRSAGWKLAEVLELLRAEVELSFFVWKIWFWKLYEYNIIIIQIMVELFKKIINV